MHAEPILPAMQATLPRQPNQRAKGTGVADRDPGRWPGEEDGVARKDGEGAENAADEVRSRNAPALPIMMSPPPAKPAGSPAGKLRGACGA